MVVVAVIGGGRTGAAGDAGRYLPVDQRPQIYVVNNYAGMDPTRLRGSSPTSMSRTSSTSTASRAIESKNIQNFVQLKLTFYPGTDMAAAMSQVVSLTNRARGQMPPSVLPPFVIRFDAASVPIGFLVLSTRPTGRWANWPTWDCSRSGQSWCGQCKARWPSRPMAATRVRSSSRSIPTGSAPHNLSPEDLVAALETGNVVVPVRQPLRRVANAAGAHQRHGGRPARDGQDSDPARQGRLHPRRGDDRGHDRHQLRLRAGQRPQVNLHSRREEGHRLNAHGGEPDPRRDA